ncbi:MAG: hypothetical protein ACK4K9_06290 [Bacteroidia bacterium]
MKKVDKIKDESENIALKVALIAFVTSFLILLVGIFIEKKSIAS